jgi:hypothetical protein
VFSCGACWNEHKGVCLAHTECSIEAYEGLANTIYINRYGVYTLFLAGKVIYGVHIRFWPTVHKDLVQPTCLITLETSTELATIWTNHGMCFDLARTIHTVVYIYGIFGRKINKYTVVYVVYIRTHGSGQPCICMLVTIN